MTDEATLVRFTDRKFRAETRQWIDQINDVLADYDYALTVRQIHYQFVARGWYENTDRNYARLGVMTVHGRNGGLIPFARIRDLTRSVTAVPTWDSADQIMRQAEAGFRLDKWASQTWAPLVMVEKAAAIGVIERVCTELEVPFLATRGYLSASEAYETAQRLRQQWDERERLPMVLYLGDHDPSGLDMTRDVKERLTRYSGRPIEVRRLGLELHQIKEYNLPPNPAKVTDKRATAYIAEYGPHSWEMDALPPDVVAVLIREAVLGLRDEDEWKRALARERRERSKLQDALRGRRREK